MGSRWCSMMTPADTIQSSSSGSEEYVTNVDVTEAVTKNKEDEIKDMPTTSNQDHDIPKDTPEEALDLETKLKAIRDNKYQNKPDSSEEDTKSVSTGVVSLSSTIHKQIGGTCYANAIATILRGTESRIIGRKIKSHQEEVDDLVSKWGDNGASCRKVLREECAKRHLGFEQKSASGAAKALLQGRPILAGFDLDDGQWSCWSKFFKDNPDKVIQRKDIGERDRVKYAKEEGHVVVIFGKSDKYWKIKNSWGDWADNGYARMAIDAFPTYCIQYYDVWFRVSTLSPADLYNYGRYNPQKCTAISIGNVIHAAANRIIWRSSSLNHIIAEILQQIKSGDSIELILRTQCMHRLLRFREVNKGEAMELINIDRPILCVFRVRDSNWNKIVYFFNDPSITSFNLHGDDWTISKEEMKTYALLVTGVSEESLELKCPWSNCYKSVSRKDTEFKLYDVDGQTCSILSHTGAQIMLI